MRLLPEPGVMPSDPSEESDEDRLVPAEAFSLLANEDRVDILLTLGDATEFGEVRTLSFSELRREVDVADSGRFNYHLDQLVGPFVKEEPDGYGLTYPGVLVHGAVRAGTLTDRSHVEPFETGETCPACGGTLEGAYRDQLLRVSCVDCGTLMGKLHVPPGARRAGADHLLRAGYGFVLREAVVIREGICPNCGDELRHDFVTEERAAEGRDLPGATVLHRCEGCGFFVHSTAALTLLVHPEVVSFFADHGVDLLAGRLDEPGLTEGGDAVEVRSRDPWRVAVTATAGDEALEVVLDGDLDVVRTERRNAED
jgi:uncharacterized Zn finger protein